ncbi:MAG TPA: hypothetical protein VER36_02675 [Flavisolibacter sp.]|nr:hypothetical protein [Flavisolibacter sp.]
MANLLKHRKEVSEKGYTTIADIFSDIEVETIIKNIQKANSDKASFRKSKDVFAIRQFLKEVPEVVPLIFSKAFFHLFRKSLVRTISL